MNELALFSGIGGISAGLKTAIPELRTVCHVEIDPYAVGVLVSRMESGDLDPAPVWDDITTFDGKPWRGVVDIISGGFPCQDISFAGKGAGLAGKRSGLWYEYVRVIREVRPRFVFVENVAALLVRGLDDVLGTLASLGYDASWHCISAASVGAPHRRDRVFIVAYANDAGSRASRRGADKYRSQEVERRGEQSQSRIGGFSTELADTNGIGAQRLFTSDTHTEEREESGKRSTRSQSDGSTKRQTKPRLGRKSYGVSSWMDTAWPARPKEDQHDWEAPRTTTQIKWRAERLHALGNAVVPQAVAFAAGKIINQLS